MMMSDKEFFSDFLMASFEQNAINPNSPYHSRMITVMTEAKDMGMSQKAFRQMVRDFIKNCKFRDTWTVADVLQHYKPAELHNYDWYMKQLATTDLNPEHFDIFLVDGEKWYCHKADSDKVKLSARVQVYEPKRYERQIEPEKLPERSEEDKERADLFQKLLDLELENEKLRKEVEYYKKKLS